jgi:hypothetical protein
VTDEESTLEMGCNLALNAWHLFFANEGLPQGMKGLFLFNKYSRRHQNRRSAPR